MSDTTKDFILKKLWRKIRWYLGARYTIEYSWDSQWVPGYRITSYDDGFMSEFMANHVAIKCAAITPNANYSYKIIKLSLDEAINFQRKKSMYYCYADGSTRYEK